MFGLRQLFGGEVPSDNLRIIITRHGERADLALGPNWIRKVQAGNAPDPRVSYLTRRASFRDWDFDPPLTVEGERQSRHVGRKLLELGYTIDYCYSSPAYRSIQTADKILEGQRRKAVPINIEPGLFECPSWYAGAPLSFIPVQHLARDRHFHVNGHYAPIYNAVDGSEDEMGYYQRSRALIDAIVNAHKSQGGTILLSGHAGSIEAVTRGMLHRRARPERLQQLAEKVNYCNFAILERDGGTGKWSVHLPSSLENPLGGQGQVQSSIPLYNITSREKRARRMSRAYHPLDYSSYGHRAHHHHHSR